MDCPKCLGKLQKKTMEYIEVDSCFACEGIWFDAGELKDAIKRDSKDFEFIDIDRDEFDGKETAGLTKELDEKKGTVPKVRRWNVVGSK